jgi:hypothetical protein
MLDLLMVTAALLAYDLVAILVIPSAVLLTWYSESEEL